MTDLAPYLDAIRARLAGLRASLRARYGWTVLELDVAVELEPITLQPILRVSGDVVVGRLARTLTELLTPMLIDDMRLDLQLRPLAIQQWYAVPQAGLQLWAEHPSRPQRSLATELWPDDGPVGHLAHEGAGMLLCARDGTIGWTTGLLGPISAARPLAAPRQRDDAGSAVCTAARGFLGVAYELGGASRRHIDCSALVARAYLDTLDLVLPRNSHDQLAVGGGGRVQGTADGAPGDLLFIHSRRLGRLHVGVIGDGTVIHASRTRGRVIEEPDVEFLLDALWVRRVPLAELLEWARSQVGRANVALPD
jgi:hypothetical protein